MGHALGMDDGRAGGVGQQAQRFGVARVAVGLENAAVVVQEREGQSKDERRHGLTLDKLQCGRMSGGVSGSESICNVFDALVRTA